MTHRRTAALFAAAATGLLLTACTPGGPAPTPTATKTGPAASPAPTAVQTATPTPDADAVPTCDTLIIPEVVDTFTAEGWTVEADTFRIGATEVPDGLWCVWGDYEIASDHVQIYGWAPVEETAARNAKTSLLESGWRTVTEGAREYVTENPDTALALDDDGYGMTYEFGDGWVTVSDTKQGLLLIERPGE